MTPLRTVYAVLFLTHVGAAPAVAQPSRQPVEALDDATFEAHYDTWHADRRDADLLRAAVWNAALIGVGTAWYWSEKDLNSLDWDYPTAWQRINGEAVRFDNNRFLTNGLGHPTAGLGYYATSRASGLEPWQAALTTFLASAVWEWGLEWREMVSINDQIFTPVGGIAMGEVAFQLGEYLNSAPGGGTWAHQIAAATLGAPHWLHDRLDGAEVSDELPTDELGFSSNWWHRFRLGYGLQSVRNEADERAEVHGVRADVELVSMPGFMDPGTFDVAFSHGNFSELTLRAGTTGSGIDSFDLRARSTLAGYYTQEVRADAAGDAHGHGVMVGVGSAFRHTDRSVLDGDQVGVASVIGVSTEVRVAAGALRVRFGGDVHADFASVRPLAYEDWRADDEQVVRSVLAEQGYYYGAGLSTRLRLELEMGGVELGGAVSHGRWRSIEGLDRKQEEVTADVSMTDQDLEYEAWAGYTLPHTPIHVRVAVSGETRSGQMDGVEAERRTHSYEAMVGLSF